MSERRNVETELNALRGEIRQSPPVDAQAPADTTAPLSDATHNASSQQQIENALAELKAAVTQLAEEAEDAIATNPLLSVGAAFLLGVAVGRLSKRT